MKDRKTFVADSFAADPDINQLTLSRSVRERYGKGISFVHLKKLRDAAKADQFHRVWHEIYGNEPDLKLSKDGMHRAHKKKKIRGDRRRKTKIKGRRDVDSNKINLREYKNHLVVYRNTDGQMHSQGFKSRKRAEKLVNDLLTGGVPANEIGYFQRNEIQTKIML